MIKSFMSFCAGAAVLSVFLYAHETLAQIERECKADQKVERQYSSPRATRI